MFYVKTIHISCLHRSYFLLFGAIKKEYAVLTYSYVWLFEYHVISGKNHFFLSVNFCKDMMMTKFKRSVLFFVHESVCKTG